MTEFRIFRFDPGKDKAPRFDSFHIQTPPQMTVLEALIHIQENHDPTLAFRSCCRAAVCGSCAMHINGEYRLACNILIKALKSNLVTIRPLAHLPVIRDLVVDLTVFYQHYEKIKPYLVPAEKLPEQEHIQTPAQRKKLDQLVDCILCAACYGSCPVAASSRQYLGPHALVKALRFIEDSRDTAPSQRLSFVATDIGIFRCHTIFNCQQVCPKDIDPTAAIARLKRKAIWWKLKSFLGFTRHGKA